MRATCTCFVFLLSIFYPFAQSTSSLDEIINKVHQESVDSLKKLDNLQRKGRDSSTPRHTYVKFNDLTNQIGFSSNANLMTLEKLLADGLKLTEIIPALQNLRHETCAGKLKQCDPKYKYRRANGTCNNLNNPTWGASYTEIDRLLPPVYTDGYNGPRGGDGIKVPYTLPNPRLVSVTIHPDLLKPDPTITNMLPQFGQFVDHDITLTPEADLTCCSNGVAVTNPPFDCRPITIFNNDTFFSSRKVPQRCMDFTRSTAYCFPNDAGIREQMNILTAFLDNSNVYGSDETRQVLVRSGIKGKLLTDSTFPKFLPTNAQVEQTFGFNPMVMGSFMAGDDRVNEMPGLTAMHTLFLREHNRIADQIYSRAPLLDDEAIFQETRRLLNAQWQNIVYGEYLPALLGPATMNKYGLNLNSWSSVYDPAADATIFHAFSDGAYRFGHTFVQGLVQLFRGTTFIGTYQVRNQFFSPSIIERDGGEGFSYIMAGLFQQNAQTYDPFVSEDLTNFVLRPPDGSQDFGADLVARNIQRGRDHGVPPWMAYRQLCKLTTSTTWSNKPSDVIQESWTKLSFLYENPGDIDLFTGGIIEIPSNGALTGATFNCLKAIQFKKLKDGDRFFFTHSGQAGSFLDHQIQHIQRRTLGDIICDNTDFQETQKNVFLTRAGTNTWVPCNSTNRAKLDISLFI